MLDIWHMQNNTTQHNMKRAVRQWVDDFATKDVILVQHESMQTCRDWDFLTNDMNSAERILPIGSWKLRNISTWRDEYERPCVTFEIQFPWKPTTSNLLNCQNGMLNFGGDRIKLRGCYEYNVRGSYYIRMQMELR